MGLFDFVKWEDDTIGKIYEPNYNYGNNKKRNTIEIFTYKEIPIMDTRIKMNMEITKMFHTIQSHFNKPNVPIMMHLMIHKHDCPHCKKSLPIFKRIAETLSSHLMNYRYGIYELGDYIKIGDERFSGADIYSYFHNREKGTRVSGVPFFVQNFKVNRVKIGDDYKLSMEKRNKLEHWDILLSGEIQPFEFLSASFNLSNPYIENY